MSTREKLGAFLRKHHGDESAQAKIGITPRMTPASENQTGGGEPDLMFNGSGLEKDPYGAGQLLIIRDEDGGGTSLLNDFLAYLTEIENYYRLKGNATPSRSLSRHDETGNANVLTYAENTGAENVYQPTSEESGDGLASTMSQYSDSNYMTNVEHVINKHGILKPSAEGSDSQDGARSGHTLLKSIQGSDLT